MDKIYLAAGLRSPIGAFGGSLMPLRATEIASAVASALLERKGMWPRERLNVDGGRWGWNIRWACRV